MGRPGRTRGTIATSGTFIRGSRDNGDGHVAGKAGHCIGCGLEPTLTLRFVRLSRGPSECLREVGDNSVRGRPRAELAARAFTDGLHEPRVRTAEVRVEEAGVAKRPHRYQDLLRVDPGLRGHLLEPRARTLVVLAECDS